MIHKYIYIHSKIINQVGYILGTIAIQASQYSIVVVIVTSTARIRSINETHFRTNRPEMCFVVFM
jgi:hypothetical protein